MASTKAIVQNIGISGLSFLGDILVGTVLYNVTGGSAKKSAFCLLIKEIDFEQT